MFKSNLPSSNTGNVPLVVVLAILVVSATTGGLSDKLKMIAGSPEGAR